MNIFFWKWAAVIISRLVVLLGLFNVVSVMYKYNALNHSATEAPEREYVYTSLFLELEPLNQTALCRHIIKNPMNCLTRLAQSLPRITLYARYTGLPGISHTLDICYYSGTHLIAYRIIA